MVSMLQKQLGTVTAGMLSVDVFEDFTWGGESLGYSCSGWVNQGDYFCNGGLIPLAARTECEAMAAAQFIGSSLGTVWRVSTPDGQPAGPVPPEATKEGQALQGARRLDCLCLKLNATAREAAICPCSRCVGIREMAGHPPLV